MTRKQRNALKLAIAEMVEFKTWRSPYAITLTHKKAIRVPNGLHYANSETYKQNLRHFLNLVEGAIFSSHERRQHRHLRVFAVLEPDSERRLHYHLAIDKPSRIDGDNFHQLIIQSWQKTYWAHKRILVVPATSEGWIDYLTKFEYSNDEDYIDWDNTRI